MDKKFLKENNLLEAHKQFMRLCEISYVPSNLEEDDDEQDPNAQGGEQSQGGDMGMGADPNAQDGAMDMGADPSMGQDPNSGGQDAAMGDANMMGGDDPMMDMGGDDPMMDMGGDDPMMGDEPDMEDDTVIDVDDITNAQEKMNAKVNTVGKDVEGLEDKISSLMQSITAMEDMINKNNSNIEAFKQEFEKRNPTQTEKLNMRSLDSYPFNVNPQSFWQSKGMTSNYDAYSDNSEPTTQEYEITNNDVDDFDERTMADSFFIDDDMQQDLMKIFGL